MTASKTRREPLLKRADFAAHLETKARETAPRDVEILVGQADEARRRAASVSPRMQQQMDLALALLADHAAGECPQIPYYTVSLLAEAVFYVLDPNDVIPDWIPGIGNLDDAVVLELAFEIGASGIGRYCAFRGIDWPEQSGRARRRRGTEAATEPPMPPAPRSRAAKRPRKSAAKAPSRKTTQRRAGSGKAATGKRGKRK